MSYYTYETSLGLLTFVDNNLGLTDIIFGRQVINDIYQETELIKCAYKQVDSYLSRSLKVFKLPLVIKRTDFEKLVWNALYEIPYGETRTYKEIAETINRPNAQRAVGVACGKNRIPIIIPCHRVIASNGIGGFSGGLEIKNELLKIEEVYISEFNKSKENTK